MSKIQELILAYNKDAKNRKLQSYYSRKSYMEKLGVARAEEPHSAFWVNLLGGNDVNCDKSDTPLMWFLQALVAREPTATAYNTNSPIPNALKKAIISRTLDLQITEIKAEKKIKELAHAYFNNNYHGLQHPEDELDIYICCKVFNVRDIEKLEIIVENKVLQQENGPKAQVKLSGYDNKSQTERYFTACNSTSSQKNVQLYVFLSPEEVDGETKACDKHFIQISYQDLLDTILIPLLESQTLLERQRFEILDYIDVLNFPTLGVKENKRIVMAQTKEQKQDLYDYEERNKELLEEALMAKLRKEKGETLQLDDQYLLNFIEGHLNILHALAASGHMNLVFSLTNTTNIVKITESKNISYHVLTQADLAVEFARLYVKHNSQKTIQDLNIAFSSVKKADNRKNLFSGSCQYKSQQHTPLYKEIAAGVWFESDCWTPRSKTWGKLIKFIEDWNNSTPTTFKYEIL